MTKWISSALLAAPAASIVLFAKFHGPHRDAQYGADLSGGRALDQSWRISRWRSVSDGPGSPILPNVEKRRGPVRS
jgi:hypothetical protein